MEAAHSLMAVAENADLQQHIEIAISVYMASLLPKQRREADQGKLREMLRRAIHEKITIALNMNSYRFNEKSLVQAAIKEVHGRRLYASYVNYMQSAGITCADILTSADFRAQPKISWAVLTPAVRWEDIERKRIRPGTGVKIVAGNQTRAYRVKSITPSCQLIFEGKRGPTDSRICEVVH